MSDVSDHFTTSVSLKCTYINRNSKIEVGYRERSESNKINLANETAWYPWTNLEHVDDPNEYYTKFSDILYRNSDKIFHSKLYLKCNWLLKRRS